MHDVGTYRPNALYSIPSPFSMSRNPCACPLRFKFYYYYYPYYFARDFALIQVNFSEEIVLRVSTKKNIIK